jgi:hypothetical protein
MKARIIIFLLLWIGFSGCAQVKFTLKYDPQSTEEISGSIKVGDFGYFPEEGIAQNEIRETAAGRIFLTEDVGAYFSNATKREFRQSGISLKGSCKLEGEVNEFLIDSLGFSSDYSTDVRYILYDESGKVLLDNNYIVKFNTSKFVVAQILLDNINKVVSDNIKQLMTDPAFLTSVQNNC